MDVLKQAALWLEGLRITHRSIPVEYARGSIRVTVNATVSRSTFDLSDEGGGVLRIETRDYLFAAQELLANGIAFPPQRGDLITEMFPFGPLDYEVIIPSKGVPCWRWDDRNHRRLRIHTALVSKETPNANP